MVKMGSMNMAKAIRRIGHRSGQARKLTFYRTAIQSKDDYGVESDTVAIGNEGLTIPNIDGFISPIITNSDSFRRAGHTTVGSATIYIPSLSTIKKNILGIPPNDARLSSFNELESQDILYDMEKIIYSAASDETSDADAVETYTITANTAGFEIDRLQFKVTNSSGTNRITTIVITDTAGKTLTWKFDEIDEVANSDINFNDAKYHIIDLPLSDVSEDDKAYCIYVPSSGATGIRTAQATLTDAGSNPSVMFDIKDIDGESRRLTTIAITANAAGMTTKDLRLYKAGEWRISAIKEYRDEYMELSCAKIRGERGSRRRAH